LPIGWVVVKRLIWTGRLAAISAGQRLRSKRHHLYRLGAASLFPFPNRTIGTIVVLALLSALLVLITGIDRSLPIVEVTGSPTVQAYSFEPKNVLREVNFGSADRDALYIMRPESGFAFVAVQFARPLSFVSIEHHYASATVFGQHVAPVQIGTIQWSEEGLSWQDAGTAHSQDGRLFFQVGHAGAHLHWRLVIPVGSEIANIAIGSLQFWRSSWQQIPVDLVWLAWCLVLFCAVATLRGGITPPRSFIIITISVSLFVLTYSFAFAPYGIITTADSPAYASPLINGTFHALRSSGFPIFLYLVDAVFGLSKLALVQLVVELCCLAFAIGLVARVYNFWIIGAFIFIVLSFFGAPVVFASRLMTEALFLSGFTLTAAALAAAAWFPTTALFVIAGIGLAIACVAKSVGIALLIPALMLARYIPRQAWGRAFAGVVVLPLAVYSLMAAHAYIRTGIPSPDATAGINLVAHVANFLDGELPDEPALIESLRAAAGPILRQRPANIGRITSKKELDDYVDYTAREHNPLLDTALIPAASNQELGDLPDINMVLFQAGLASIFAHPLDYALQVTAHYYGMWRDLGRYRPKHLISAACYIRLVVDDPHVALSSEQFNKYFASLLRPVVSAEAASAQQRRIPIALWRWLELPMLLDEAVTLSIGTLALLLPIFWLLPGSLPRVYRSEVILALLLDAYVLGHALFQVALEHYAAVLMPVAVLLAVCFGTTTLRLIFGRNPPCWSVHLEHSSSLEPTTACKDSTIKRIDASGRSGGNHRGSLQREQST
jgi:hypothetical protein